MVGLFSRGKSGKGGGPGPSSVPEVGSDGSTGAPGSGGTGTGSSAIVPVTQGIAEAQLKAMVDSAKAEIAAAASSGGGSGESARPNYETVGDIVVPTVSHVDPQYDRGDLEIRRSLIPTLEGSVILNFMTSRFLWGGLYGFVSALVLKAGLSFGLSGFTSAGVGFVSVVKAYATLLITLGLTVGLIIIPLGVVGLWYMETWSQKSSKKFNVQMWLVIGLGSSALGLVILLLAGLATLFL